MSSLIGRQSVGSGAPKRSTGPVQCPDILSPLYEEQPVLWLFSRNWHSHKTGTGATSASHPNTETQRRHQARRAAAKLALGATVFSLPLGQALVQRNRSRDGIRHHFGAQFQPAQTVSPRPPSRPRAPESSWRTCNAPSVWSKARALEKSRKSWKSRLLQREKDTRGQI